jgi:hypothetical protein
MAINAEINAVRANNKTAINANRNSTINAVNGTINAVEM